MQPVVSRRDLLLLQGVSIQNLGIFSFATKTVDIGNNRSIVLQRPVFLLSEKFAQTHCIRYAKQYIPGECIRTRKHCLSTGTLPWTFTHLYMYAPTYIVTCTHAYTCLQTYGRTYVHM